jgi:hypothetical protein
MSVIGAQVDRDAAFAGAAVQSRRAAFRLGSRCFGVFRFVSSHLVMPRRVASRRAVQLAALL